MTTTTKSNNDVILAAVEGGGTTFILCIARLNSSANASCLPGTNIEVLHRASISSQSPSSTLSQSADFFRKHIPANSGYAALGIATFGPVGVNPSQPDKYGRILPSTPKKIWRNVDILTPILDACTLNIGDRTIVPPYRVDTDVNAPALAEFTVTNKNRKKPITSLAYVTVGTGVGVGLVVNSKPVHGMMHPEGGHVPVAPLKDEEGGFQGYSWGAEHSPFKGINTVEGVASSVALAERLFHRTSSDKSAEDASDEERRDALKHMPDSDPIWDQAANALANLCVTLSLLCSVEKIVLGGGVMRRTILYDKIRLQTKELLNNYLDLDQVTTEQGLREFIGPSQWGDESGLIGTLLLAQTVYEDDVIGHGEKETLAAISLSAGANAAGAFGLFSSILFWDGFVSGVATASILGIGALFLLGRHVGGGRGK